MHVILSLVDKNIGLSFLQKSRLGRKNIKKGFRGMGGDIGDHVVLELFQRAIQFLKIREYVNNWKTYLSTFCRTA